MKKIVMVVFLVLFLVNFVWASCSEGQININTASAEELDQIKHVGLAIAGYIIDYRTNNKTFDSLDELVVIKYLTENRVNEIKVQGLACVEEDDSGNDPNPTGENETENNQEGDEENKTEYSIPKIVEKTSIKKEQDNSPIVLTPKDIKTSGSDVSSGSISYSKYSIVVFCVLLVLLYMLKPKKKKNEFKE